MSVHAFQCHNAIRNIIIAIVSYSDYCQEIVSISSNTTVIYTQPCPPRIPLPMRVTWSLSECRCFYFGLFSPSLTLSLRTSHSSPMMPGILPMGYHTGACGSVDPSSSASCERDTDILSNEHISFSRNESIARWWILSNKRQITQNYRQIQLHYSFNMLFCNLV